jgi:hypothetical protein
LLTHIFAKAWRHGEEIPGINRLSRNVLLKERLKNVKEIDFVIE